MKESIQVRLWDFLEHEGFIENGTMCRFNSEGFYYDEFVSTFFTDLVNIGEIVAFSFTDEEIYSDVCGTLGAVSCAWFNGREMDMVILNTEE